jgi:hypothetical protein
MQRPGRETPVRADAESVGHRSSRRATSLPVSATESPPTPAIVPEYTLPSELQRQLARRGVVWNSAAVIIIAGIVITNALLDRPQLTWSSVWPYLALKIASGVPCVTVLWMCLKTARRLEAMVLAISRGSPSDISSVIADHAGRKRNSVLKHSQITEDIEHERVKRSNGKDQIKKSVRSATPKNSA